MVLTDILGISCTCILSWYKKRSCCCTSQISCACPCTLSAISIPQSGHFIHSPLVHLTAIPDGRGIIQHALMHLCLKAKHDMQSRELQLIMVALLYQELAHSFL